MSIKRLLQNGSQGNDVKELQQMLNTKGYNLGVDGIFGNQTQSAVKNFQQKSGLTVDGIVGNHTMTALAGGGGGSSQSANTTAPTIAPAPTAPTYNTQTWDESTKGSAAGQAYEDAKNALAGYGDFVFSEQDWLNGLKQNIQNYGEFSYDVNSDALYQQLAEQYMSKGNLAMQDAMGQAAAMTGGYGNSYAATVGNQAYQSYLQQLNDKVPELYQLALERYNMGKQDLYDQYGMLLNEYEREYGMYSDEYQKLVQALGIASDDYYKGADMFYSEQENQNGVLGQQFTDAMAIWSADNDNYWNQQNYDLNERQVSLQEQQYADSKNTVTNNTGNKGNNVNKGNTNNTGNTGGTIDTATVPDSVRQKAASFESNTALGNYLDGLEASGVITPEQSDALYAEFVDDNEKYVKKDDGSTAISYKDMIGSTKGWSAVSKGGGNLLGIDANAIVKAPNGETIRLDQLRDKLKAEGMSQSEATNYIKKLQQNLGISSNWMFGW